MENNILNLIPDFENLLQEKEFEQLDIRQKELILRVMTKEEYDRMHILVITSAKGFDNERNELFPSAKSQDRLLDEIRNKVSKESYWKKIEGILNYKIPAYQFALLLILGLLLLNKMYVQSPQSVVIDHRVDTVFVEKAAPAQSAITQRASNTMKSETGIKKNFMINDNRPKEFHNAQKKNVPDMYPERYQVLFANVMNHMKNERIGRPIESDSNLFRRLVVIQ